MLGIASYVIPCKDPVYPWGPNCLGMGVAQQRLQGLCARQDLGKDSACMVLNREVSQIERTKGNTGIPKKHYSTKRYNPQGLGFRV